MKDDNNRKDYNDYHKGRCIASQIGRLMQHENISHKELDEWLSDTKSSKEVSERLSSETALTKMCDNFEREEKYLSSKHLTDTLKKRRSKVGKLRLIKLVSTSCAAAIIAISFLIHTHTEPQEVKNSSAKIITTGIIKGSFIKPTLILNNGKKIDLTTINTINLIDKKNHPLTIDTVDYNRIIIPKKYNYTVVLEDGTTVHLNSCSELRYPAKFGSDKREVFLSGEAFFEVKKGKTPFIVTINDISVRVYGTKFNINAHNINNIQTALIEGSVSVKQKGDTLETFIKPNQLLTINIDGVKTVNNILPERYTAWMDGFIRSDEEPISNLLDNIANWYGVEFLYREDIKSININASLNRTRPLEEIIKAIETISGLKITKQEGEKYMVQ